MQEKLYPNDAVGYINIIGMIITAAASLGLSTQFFLSMGNGYTALVFLAIGVSAELGKYCAVVMTTTHHYQGSKGKVFIFGMVTALLISVSIMGSIASLLGSSHGFDRQSNIESRLLDVERRIALEENNIKEASKRNSQTTGVKPSRESLKILAEEKKELLRDKEMILSKRTNFEALVIAISDENSVEPDSVYRFLSIMVACLLEGLCILFTIANVTFRGNTSNATLNDMGSDEGSEREGEYEAIIDEEERFRLLIEAIQSKEIKPNHKNIRTFMSVKSNRVSDIRKRLLEEKVVIEGPRSSLIPV